MVVAAASVTLLISDDGLAAGRDAGACTATAGEDDDYASTDHWY